MYTYQVIDWNDQVHEVNAGSPDEAELMIEMREGVVVVEVRDAAC